MAPRLKFVPRIRRGPALMLGATLAFTLMVACVKDARDELDAIEVIVWRTLVSVPLALFLVRKVGLRAKAKGWLALRVTFGTLAMLCFFTAAKGLSVGDLSIIARLQPIVVAIMAPVVLGASERPGGRIWGLLLLGLAGCGFIIGPEMVATGFDVANVFGVYALAAAVLSAGAHTCVRRLGRSDDPRVVVVWFQLGACAASLVIFVAIHGRLPGVPPESVWLSLAGVGIFATVGQVLMTYAYQAEKAPTIAAASYAAPAFGIAIDLVAFGALPSGYAIIGGVLVVLSGLLLVFR